MIQSVAHMELNLPRDGTKKRDIITEETRPLKQFKFIYLCCQRGSAYLTDTALGWHVLRERVYIYLGAVSQQAFTLKVR